MRVEDDGRNKVKEDMVAVCPQRLEGKEVNGKSFLCSSRPHLMSHTVCTHIVNLGISHLQLVEALQECPLSFLLHVVIRCFLQNEREEDSCDEQGSYLLLPLPLCRSLPIPLLSSSYLPPFPSFPSLPSLHSSTPSLLLSLFFPPTSPLPPPPSPLTPYSCHKVRMPYNRPDEKPVICH